MYGTQNTELLTGHLLLEHVLLVSLSLAICVCRVLLDFCAVY